VCRQLTRDLFAIAKFLLAYPQCVTGIPLLCVICVPAQAPQENKGTFFRNLTLNSAVFWLFIIPLHIPREIVTR